MRKKARKICVNIIFAVNDSEVSKTSDILKTKHRKTEFTTIQHIQLLNFGKVLNEEFYFV